MESSSALDRRLREVEEQIGKRIVLRPVRGPERNFRGRIASIPGAVVLEYRDETAGYFWDSDIIEELLDHLAAGGGPVERWDLPEAPGTSEGSPAKQGDFPSEDECSDKP